MVGVPGCKKPTIGFFLAFSARRFAVQLLFLARLSVSRPSRRENAKTKNDDNDRPAAAGASSPC